MPNFAFNSSTEAGITKLAIFLLHSENENIRGIFKEILSTF